MFSQNRNDKRETVFRPPHFFVGLLMMLLFVLAGCSSSLVVRVDTIAAEGAGIGGAYQLQSGMDNVAEDDLHFQEFSAYVRAALRRRGYHEVTVAAGTDLIIYFSYGMTPGETHYYTMSTPVYDWVGGETIQYDETQTDESGKVTRTAGTTTLPLRYRVIGTERSTHSFTPYTSHAIVEARVAETNRPLWKTSVSSTGPARDLRATMSVLLSVAAPYLGRDTNGLITLKVPEPDVKTLRPSGGER